MAVAHVHRDTMARAVAQHAVLKLVVVIRSHEGSSWIAPASPGLWPGR